MAKRKTFKDELHVLKKNLKLMQGSQSVPQYAARLGFSEKYLTTLLESSNANPTLKTLHKLSISLGCTVAELFEDMN